MQKKIYLTLLCIFAACSCFAAVKFDNNGVIRCAGFNVRMLCVNKRWAWRDNKKLQDVKTVRKAGKFSTSGSCFVGGSTVNMFIDSQQGRDGFYQVDGKVTIAPAQELARCLWGFDFDIHDSEIVVDGRRVKVKPDGEKGFWQELLITAKWKSLPTEPR